MTLQTHRHCDACGNEWWATKRTKPIMRPGPIAFNAGENLGLQDQWRRYEEWARCPKCGSEAVRNASRVDDYLQTRPRRKLTEGKRAYQQRVERWKNAPGGPAYEVAQAQARAAAARERADDARRKADASLAALGFANTDELLAQSRRNAQQADVAHAQHVEMMRRLEAMKGWPKESRSTSCPGCGEHVTLMTPECKHCGAHIPFPDAPPRPSRSNALDTQSLATKEGGTVQVQLDTEDIRIALKDNGVVLRISDDAGKHLGDLRVTKDTLEWRKSRARAHNARRVSLEQLIEYLSGQ